MTTPLKTASLAALLALPGLAAAATFLPLVIGEEPLSDRDLKKVAATLAEWTEARKEGTGYSELQEDVEKEIAKAGKKVGGDGKSTDALLAHPWSLARAAWLAKDYGKLASKQRKSFGKITDQSIEFRGAEIHYSLWLPGKYKPDDGPYPVLLTIPDEGVNPEEHIMEKWVEGDIRDNYIIAAPKMPGNAGEWTDLMGGVASMIVTLRDLRENYAVDYDRVFIGGRGRGAEAAHFVANNYIENFAGYFAWAGDASEFARPENFRNTPVFFAGGGTRATAFQEAAQAAGIETVTAKQDGKAMDIFAWAQGIRRDPYAPSVSLVQADGAPLNYSWLQIPRYASETGTETFKISADVDRATNTITIEADGVDGATLFLSHALVDLDQPITVVANGVESKFSERPSMTRALEFYFLGRSDPGRFFVASRDITIPARASEDAGAGEGEGKGE